MKLFLACLLAVGFIDLAFSAACKFNTLTQADRDAIAAAHNSYRSVLAKGQAIMNNGQYAPPAKNMYTIQYDCDLENIAQAYANKCVFEHSSSGERDGAGENLFMSTGNLGNSPALKQSADLWWAELKQKGITAFSSNDTTYQSTSEYHDAGHFTQMAWAKTTKIGCGVTWCPNRPMTIVVCNYKEAGNFLGAKIYEVGSACASNSQCTTVPQSTCDPSSGLCSSDYVAPCADVGADYACQQWVAAGYCDKSSPYYTFVAQQQCMKSCKSC